jgi:hypothetical protein
MPGLRYPMDALPPVPSPKERSLSLTFDEYKDEHFTQLSRRIQLELRDKEMIELAHEAERAAEAGQERFVGSATVFGLGLDYDPTKIKGFRQDSSASVEESTHDSMDMRHRKATDGTESVQDFSGEGSSRSLLGTPISTVGRLSQSMQGSSLFLPIIHTEPLPPRVRVMNLRPIDGLVPAFKDAHYFLGQNLMQTGADLGKDLDCNDVSCHSKDSCNRSSNWIFPCRHKTSSNPTESFVTNYFYTGDKHLLMSHSADFSQPPENTCGREYCHDSSCAQIGCLMIDSTIKSFFHDQNTARKTAIIFNDVQDNQFITVGGLTYRLPRHDFTHS